MEITENEEGKRVDLFLSESLKKRGFVVFSRSFLQENWDKLISVNNSFPKTSYKLRKGDRVEIDWEKLKKLESSLDRSDDIIPEEGDLDILFETEDFLIIDKPKGIAVHPGIGNLSNTLVNRVRGYLELKGVYDKNLKRAGLVHRLDKGVSGVMVFAKTVPMQNKLQKQFEARIAKKIYLAQVEFRQLVTDIENILPQKSLDIYKEVEDIERRKFIFNEEWYKVEGYIERSSKNRIKMAFKRYKSGGAKNALSYIKPVSQDLLLVSIETGRMHQIRATLEYMGIYIKGDTLYKNNKGKNIPERIELRSIFLSFLDLKDEYFSICKI
ncbi:MAG: RluA family pseudouridine synthase [Candidatus Dojkabacteria bacterium]|nr:RluA family pseudouridine synthase [Candidatus Dojkabacteria bacterium]MDD4560888.1 RluA family pseudouridine synthase [Candidatus Dojkabacteria bacterium]